MWIAVSSSLDFTLFAQAERRRGEAEEGRTRRHGFPKIGTDKAETREAAKATFASSASFDSERDSCCVAGNSTSMRPAGEEVLRACCTALMAWEETAAGVRGRVDNPNCKPDEFVASSTRRSSSLIVVVELVAVDGTQFL